ncbi:MAG: translation initiation factor IF-2 subunit beta [Thaumarchaeota archaeon]|nr:translation initiation factor IF-2 subunit beta [Candidatus Calditenuaceae archaeon]MDW8042997.1 translation initiation factor IF-2 subunit beta [Nitrososphaerota archaeon]
MELRGRASYEMLLERVRAQLRAKSSASGEREIALRPSLYHDERRTIVLNFRQLADSLSREPEHVARFIFKESGKPGSLEGDRLILNGKIGDPEFAKLLQLYFKEFVKCPVCGGIDTQIQREKKFRYLVCEACGARTPVRKV